MSALTAAGAVVSACVVSFEDYPVGNLDAAGAAGAPNRAGGAAGTIYTTAGSGGTGGTANTGGAPNSGGTGAGGNNQGGAAGLALSGGDGGVAQTGGGAPPAGGAGGGGAPPAGGAGGVSGVSGTAATGGVAAAGAGGTAGIAGSAGGVAGFAGMPGGGTAGRGGEPGVAGAAGGGNAGAAGDTAGGAPGGGGDSGMAGAGGVSGTAGGGTGGVMVGPEELVINEIDYDQESTDMDEFVEIYNTSTNGWVDLTGIVLVLVNGANPNNQVEYKRVPLAGELGPEQYLVVASDTVTVAPEALVIRFVDADGQDIIQNGDPDGLALVDTTTNALLDALSYEGTVDRAIITGLSGEHNLVEGTETSVADVNVGLASLVRYPNGQDTDDASNDWWLSAVPTPGAANTL